MAHEDKEAEIVEPAPQAKPKLTLIIILAVLLGVFLTLLTGGAIYHVQSGKTMQAELAVAREELKRKTLMLTEAQEQIANLSIQMHTLREFSVAKASSVAAEKEVAVDKAQAATENSSTHAPASEAGKKEQPAPVVPAAAPPPVAPPAPKAPAATLETKKAKPGNLDCQITGKSPEEQQATLKRCTQAMDGKK
jgi:flagellar basal body-associated protein FliL